MPPGRFAPRTPRLPVAATASLALLLACAPSPDADPEATTEHARSAELRLRTPLPKRPPIPPADREHRLVVKFADALQVRPGTADALRSATGQPLHPIDAVRRRAGLRFAPLLRMDQTRVDDLLARARARSGRAQPDLFGMYVVTTLGGEVPSRDVAAELGALPDVEFAAYESLGVPPPVDIAPPTPSLVDLQGHLGPGIGIDAQGAWAMGFDGTGIRISDIEFAWHLGHEEWNEGQMIAEPGQTPAESTLEFEDHGTAVAGELIAGDSGYGITGMSPGSQLGVYPEFTVESGSRRAEAILSAAADSSPGDVLILEIQTGEPVLGTLGPGEIEESVWMATRVATDAGIVVTAAAGNGSTDLDRPELAYYRDRGDSGAIIVGAGMPMTREWLNFSTFGARVDVQGWGTDVFTAGYGQYATYGDDVNQRYTASFAGTSSATPFAAAAAAIVQQAVQASGGEPLTSAQMRAVLRGTGLPQQGAGGNIGPLPQVPAAIGAALLPMDAPPEVSIVTPTPTQTEANTLMTAVEITASADTAWVELSINGEIQPLIDDVAPYGFATVEFPVGTWELVAVATNIWGVEGSSEPVVLEVGYEPPATSTSGGDSSSTGGGDTSTTAVPDAADSSSGDDDSTGGAQATGDGDGCGCTATPRPAGWAFAIVIAAISRRRRRLIPPAR